MRPHGHAVPKITIGVRKMKRLISGITSAAILLCGAVLLPTSASETTPPRLKEDSALIMTRDGSAVCGTGGEISAERLVGEFDGEVSVKLPDGNTAPADARVPTGSTVEGSDGGSVGVLISGDVDCDGKIGLSDVIAMLKRIAGWNTEINEAAAELVGNDGVDLSDAVVLLRYIADWDVRLGSMRIIMSEEPLVAADEDAGVALWTTHGNVKLKKNDATSTGKCTYLINAAKNEAETANIYISPDEKKTDVTVSSTDFVNCYGDTVKCETFILYYHNMESYGTAPDAMMPSYSTYSATVKDGNSQGFVVKASTDENSTAGLYEATVSIMSEGKEIKRARIYLNVWDFTLDDTDAPRSSFGLGGPTASALQSLNGVTDDAERLEQYKQCYDLLLENRMCAYTLPYKIETPEADEYLNDPRVNSFVVKGEGYGGTMDATDEQVKARYEKLSQNEEWFEKGYFYLIDEPYDEKDAVSGVYEQMRTARSYIDSIYPGGKQVIPIETGHHITLYDGIMDLYRETCDIYCPKTYAYLPEKYRADNPLLSFMTPEYVAANGTYKDIVTECVENDGKEAWWYFAGLPAMPCATYHAHADGMYTRVSGWQMFQEDVTGVLYYLVDDYRGVNPLFNISYPIGLDGGIDAWGNGILIYPAARYGIAGGIESIRVEHIRDSFEDYMYLKMAERIIGEEKTEQLLLKVTRDLLDFETDADTVLAVRAELAEAIMSGNR